VADLGKANSEGADLCRASLRGCAMLVAVFVSVLGIAAAVTFAVHRDTDGLLLVIALSMLRL